MHLVSYSSIQRLGTKLFVLQHWSSPSDKLEVLTEPQDWQAKRLPTWIKLIRNIFLKNYYFDSSNNWVSSVFISVINQLDAQDFCFTISSFHASTCFEHMCPKHVEAWNELIVKQNFCASSWLITEIHGQQNVKISLVYSVRYFFLQILKPYLKTIKSEHFFPYLSTALSYELIFKDIS